MGRVLTYRSDVKREKCGEREELLMTRAGLSSLKHGGRTVMTSARGCLWDGPLVLIDDVTAEGGRMNSDVCRTAVSAHIELNASELRTVSAHIELNASELSSLFLLTSS